jgi:hypothetical protein
VIALLLRLDYSVANAGNADQEDSSAWLINGRRANPSGERALQPSLSGRIF